MKPVFLYAGGTAYLAQLMIPALNNFSVFSGSIDGQWRIGGLPVGAPLPAKTGIVRGVTEARNAPWTLEPGADPFPVMLDPDLWEKRETIAYPAAFLHIGECINYGRDRMIEKILALQPGQKWAMGGYSQGAAVCGAVWKSGVKSGTTGPLESKAADFLGCVTFGSPVRQINHRGAGGEFGTWSGSWFDDEIHTGCGGAFPATGPHSRLTGCPDEWVDFTAPLDIFSSHGASTTETNWTNAIDFALGTLDPGELATLLLTNGLIPAAQTAINLLFGDGYGATGKNYFVDATGMCFPFPGGGHTIYPMLPPPDDEGVIPTIPVTGPDDETYYAPDGKTCYQLAVEFMDNLAKPFQVAPIVLPPSAAGGWSTTLIPPAA